MDRMLGMQLFIRVVETGSFSKASADLGITQPTATKHVAALEKRLGARLFHRSTRGVTPTEIGALYYEKCILIVREMEEADNLATLQQSQTRGVLRISTSVAFGRRVMVPLTIGFMREHPQLQIDLSFDDRYVNLVEQGVDLAIRMGQLADSSLGASYLGVNPWVLVASPAYLQAHGTPTHPDELSRHAALIYSTVQGDERWRFVGNGQTVQVPVQGPLRSNNLSALLAAARAGLGVAVLPWYVAHASVRDGAVQPLLADWTLPSQAIHAVFPSPRLVPAKVTRLLTWLQGKFDEGWWATKREV
ncbi:LysR family transcriptional regulator [Pelomonas sp. KK5]|uniref:LysR family transcriptional regulator n=1 Tax=Pelomonas sp. KK5 TaxID=1855730 RepID=UPI00097CAEA9|nr:LysR family transcriptional regulator [Pelomonas sp. KK5]